MSIVARRLAQAKQDKAGQKKQGVQAKPATAVTEKAAAAPFRTGVMKEFDMFNIAMESDLAQLKQFKTLEEKSQYKAEAIRINDYLGYVSRYIESGANHPNAVLTWLVIWLVDLGRWDEALKFLPLLVEQQQHLPPQFNTKDWPTFFIDQLYDEGARQLDKAKDTLELVWLKEVIRWFYVLIGFIEQKQLTGNDIVFGKLYAMACKLEESRFNYGNALHHGITATKINDKAGVKGLVRDIAKKLGQEEQVNELLK